MEAKKTESERYQYIISMDVLDKQKMIKFIENLLEQTLIEKNNIQSLDEASIPSYLGPKKAMIVLYNDRIEEYERFKKESMELFYHNKIPESDRYITAFNKIRNLMNKE